MVRRSNPCIVVDIWTGPAMTDLGKQLSRTHDLSTKVTQLFQKRAQTAQQRFTERVQGAYAKHVADLMSKPMSPWDIWTDWSRYAVDFAQRSTLFWDAIRQRGNQYVEHVRAGQPPVLHFDYEVVLDARTFQRPVNYALLRIVPPAGVTVDPKRRPYIIIDPRAGHGPGIGGFKDDSQVGVALREGHPVYFVMFYPQPEPGQTLLDVTEAERQFVHRVRELHPDSAKPVIVGNCQGGWAAMMLAAADPEEMGPIVINGAPMSYWGGAWGAEQAENPMRYSGGNLGGTWLSSLTADLGNGIFDGAHLVQNFENLHPSNTFWDKYYNLFANVDTERPRFLEFERWWGGFFLLNREEIEWITQELFVGNDLWSGKVSSRTGEPIDLKRIKSPIILFASMGDNITPAQQAFNWVADVYGSTDEIKARGQVIVGLLHKSIGHLGIFVSGAVAKKEHAQIVSVLKSIEALPPGLFGMEIVETKGADGKPGYEVQFHERRLEEVIDLANRFKRVDEKPFEAVEAVSDFNQRAYELFAQPLVQAMSNEYAAKLARELHPLRLQRWAFSDLNPWLAWLKPAAAMAQGNRQALGADAPSRRIEQMMSEVVSASLDYYRDVRDAMSEAVFFQTYGNMFALYLADKHEAESARAKRVDARDAPFVKEALASIEKGGYAAAAARIAALLAEDDPTIPLAQYELKQELAADYAAYLPALARDEMRRVRGEQDIIVRYARERSIETLPKLLGERADRERLLTLMDKLGADPRLFGRPMSAHDRDVIERVRKVLGASAPRLAAVRKSEAA
jgi:pimeloyl-ACP methyl ester carboxylesterase